MHRGVAKLSPDPGTNVSTETVSETVLRGAEDSDLMMDRLARRAARAYEDTADARVVQYDTARTADGVTVEVESFVIIGERHYRVNDIFTVHREKYVWIMLQEYIFEHDERLLPDMRASLRRNECFINCDTCVAWIGHVERRCDAIFDYPVTDDSPWGSRYVDLFLKKAQGDQEFRFFLLDCRKDAIDALVESRMARKDAETAREAACAKLMAIESELVALQGEHAKIRFAYDTLRELVKRAGDRDRDRPSRNSDGGGDDDEAAAMRTRIRTLEQQLDAVGSPEAAEAFAVATNKYKQMADKHALAAEKASRELQHAKTVLTSLRAENAALLRKLEAVTDVGDPVASAGCYDAMLDDTTRDADADADVSDDGYVSVDEARIELERGCQLSPGEKRANAELKREHEMRKKLRARGEGDATTGMVPDADATRSYVSESDDEDAVVIETAAAVSSRPSVSVKAVDRERREAFMAWEAKPALAVSTRFPTEAPWEPVYATKAARSPVLTCPVPGLLRSATEMRRDKAKAEAEAAAVVAIAASEPARPAQGFIHLRERLKRLSKDEILKQYPKFDGSVYFDAGRVHFVGSGSSAALGRELVPGSTKLRFGFDEHKRVMKFDYAFERPGGERGLIVRATNQTRAHFGVPVSSCASVEVVGE